MASRLGLGPAVISLLSLPHCSRLPQGQGPAWPSPGPSVASAVSAVTAPHPAWAWLPGSLPCSGFQGRGPQSERRQTHRSVNTGDAVSSACSSPLSSAFARLGACRQDSGPSLAAAPSPGRAEYSEQVCERYSKAGNCRATGSSSLSLGLPLWDPAGSDSPQWGRPRSLVQVPRPGSLTRLNPLPSSPAPASGLLRRFCHYARDFEQLGQRPGRLCGPLMVRPLSIKPRAGPGWATRSAGPPTGGCRRGGCRLPSGLTS